jgi:hypothetical protein
MISVFGPTHLSLTFSAHTCSASSQDGFASVFCNLWVLDLLLHFW